MHDIQLSVTRLADVNGSAVTQLAHHYHASVVRVDDGASIPGSFWGEPEAGLVGGNIYVRSDTPAHSYLHELSHFICMTSIRRQQLDTNAGGNDAEESAVCYLQVLLAVDLGFTREQIFRDMDRWGYSFRLGSTQAWFEQDANDASCWLQQFGVIDAEHLPTGKLREEEACG